MIAITRLPIPKTLEDHAVEWRDAYLSAKENELLNPTDKTLTIKRKNAEKKYAQADVKSTLKTMFSRKCAFCERLRDQPHIEHFWPKTTYPEKCFDWFNLILACETCNGLEFKGIKFPLDFDKKPLFVNPCDDDPSVHFDFVCEVDSNHEHGFIAVVKPKTKAGRITVKEIGLNRPNLLQERTDFMLMTLYTALKAGEGDEEAISKLKKACEPRFIFSAFAKTLYQKYVEKI